ncbi:MAG: hypothetical protein JNK48_02880 [Bryobacterales bacterium]|nr:hypothetical protein [Bryobacterales bacterium]
MWIILLFAAAAADGPAMPDCSAVPGFTAKGPARAFNVETLFEYMNGNSEGYFAYGFRQMRGITCTGGKLDLVFDISEMETPELAWGMFMANRDPKLPMAKFGPVAQVTPRRGAFAKGNAFVEVAANPTAAPDIIERFLAYWEKRLPGESKAPALLDVFPKQGLVPDSLRLVPESVLGFRMLRRGFVGQYEHGKAFLIPEASPQAASKVLAQLKQRLNATETASLGDDSFQVKDKYLGRICVFRKGSILAGTANFPDSVDPATLAKEIAARLP